ncbi:hypothetical protein BH11MYX2_BH11MYX2_19520 [soil metagenome]
MFRIVAVVAVVAVVGCGGGRTSSSVPSEAPYAALFGDARSWRFEAELESEGGVTHSPMICHASPAVRQGRVQIVPLRCKTDVPGAEEWLDREFLFTDLGMSSTADEHGRVLLQDDTDLAPLVAADKVLIPPRPVAGRRTYQLPCCVSYSDQPALDVERRLIPFGEAWCIAQRVTSASRSSSEMLCFDARRGLIGGALTREDRVIRFGDTPPTRS